LAASSNTGPLIWLGKCRILELLYKLYPGAVISEAVYEEAVSRGAEKGHDDAHVIAKAIDDGWIRVHSTSRQFTEKVKAEESRLGIELGEGERETIALAIEKGIPTLLTDDEDAYRVGKSLGLDPKGTLHVLLESVKKGYLNRKQASEHLSQMLEEGFWLSPTIIHNFHETLGKL
jgi:predicted nucleic acid-binding protein